MRLKILGSHVKWNPQKRMAIAEVKVGEKTVVTMSIFSTPAFTPAPLYKVVYDAPNSLGSRNTHEKILYRGADLSAATTALEEHNKNLEEDAPTLARLGEEKSDFILPDDSFSLKTKDEVLFLSEEKDVTPRVLALIGDTPSFGFHSHLLTDQGDTTAQVLLNHHATTKKNSGLETAILFRSPGERAVILTAEVEDDEDEDGGNTRGKTKSKSKSDKVTSRPLMKTYTVYTLGADGTISELDYTEEQYLWAVKNAPTEAELVLI